MSAEGPRLRLDHIGIAVENLDEARQRYAKLLGIAASPVEEVPGERVRVSFFDLDGCRLELLEATSPDSPIRKFLDAGRSGVHHVSLALEAGGLVRLLSELAERGVEVLKDARGEKLRPGSEGNKVFFVHPRAAEGVLIEFSEERRAGER